MLPSLAYILKYEKLQTFNLVETQQQMAHLSDPIPTLPTRQDVRLRRSLDGEVKENSM